MRRPNAKVKKSDYRARSHWMRVGPIFCAFWIQIGPQILGREDRNASDIVQTSMEKDGVTFLVNTSTKSISEDDSGFTLVIEQDNTTQNLKVDELLVDTGRRPNVNSLNAEAASVQLD